jgi:hypothetical protein
MIRNKIFFGFILVAVWCALPCSRPLAQSTDLVRLEEEIRRNAELIHEAERLIAETSSTKARASLQAAILLHKESLQLVSNKQHLLAARAVKKAREAVLRAIALAKMEAKTEESAKRMIERSRRRLETAKNMLEESSQPDLGAARKMIDEAQVQLHRSIDNMREHLFSAALQLASSSERLSNQAISLLKKTHQGLNDVARELAKTDRVLHRIDSHGGLEQFPTAEKRYREALELQMRANHQSRSGHPRRAIELTQRARMIALNVAKTLSSSPSPENVETALDLTEGLLDRAGEIASGEESKTVAQKLSNAFELQEQAKSYYSNQNYTRALRLTLRARELVKEAISKLEKPLNEEGVEAAIRSTDSLIESLRNRMNQSNDPTDQELFQRLVSHQESAWIEFKKEKFRSALARTKLARNLARKILERIDEGRF